MFANKKVTGGIVAGCTFIALIVSFLMPKTYTSTAMLDVGGYGSFLSTTGFIRSIENDTKNNVNPGPLGVAKMMQAGDYLTIIMSEPVVEPVIEDLYVDVEKIKRPTVASFVKSSLDVQLLRGNNIISIKGIGSSPEEAQKIAQGVIDSFFSLMKERGHESLSIMNEQIDIAWQSAKEADKKLSDFEKAATLDSTDKELNQLARDAQIKRQIYDDLLNQMKADNLQQILSTTSVRVLAPASLPREDQPSGSRQKVIVGVGFCVGCLISLLYGIVLYKRNY